MFAISGSKALITFDCLDNLHKLCRLIVWIDFNTVTYEYCTDDHKLPDIPVRSETDTLLVLLE